jgi:hypothetical protein
MVKKTNTIYTTYAAALTYSKKRYIPGSRGLDILIYYFDRVLVKSFHRDRSIEYFILLYNLYTYTRIIRILLQIVVACYYILPTYFTRLRVHVQSFTPSAVYAFIKRTRIHIIGVVRFLDNFSQTFSYIFMNILLHTSIVIFRLARLEYLCAMPYLYACGFFFFYKLPYIPAHYTTILSGRLLTTFAAI